MVSQTRHLEITVTRSEGESLLLESNLIKQNRPYFNVLLKDDKSLAHILITNDHEFPQLKKHRGAQKQNGSYYGPFASTSSVNKTLTTLPTRLFATQLYRQHYAARSRPCLQYQIKRCTAPYVGLDAIILPALLLLASTLVIIRFSALSYSLSRCVGLVFIGLYIGFLFIQTIIYNA